jgi:tRNA (pseudouridine54-N1)-methyltransferase
MREFVYYSRSAVTAGNLIGDNLMKAGRMDIVCNVIVSVFFVSNAMRDDIRLHLIFDGGPNNPRHLVLESNEEMPISKKDVAGLIKRMLYKAKDEEGLREICPGCFIEKKSFEKVLKGLDSEGKNVLVLDGKGKDIRSVDLKGNEVFVIGDHEGFPSDKKKFLKRIDKVSVGPRVLFASQVVTLVHNEIDRGSLS